MELLDIMLILGMCSNPNARNLDLIVNKLEMLPQCKVKVQEALQNIFSLLFQKIQPYESGTSANPNQRTSIVPQQNTNTSNVPTHPIPKFLPLHATMWI